MGLSHQYGDKLQISDDYMLERSQIAELYLVPTLPWRG